MAGKRGRGEFNQENEKVKVASANVMQRLVAEGKQGK